MAAAPRRLVALALVAAASVVIFAALRRDETPARNLLPHGELRIGVDASFPPFAAVTDDGLTGIDIELGHAIGGQLEVPVRFVNMGFDGLYDALRADQVDILLSALLVDPIRQDQVSYTRSYFDAGLVLVSAANNPIEAMSALPGRALAFEFGSAADAEARAWLRRVAPFETQPYELPAHALDAVRRGAADAALVDAVSARLYLGEYGWNAPVHYVTEALYAIAVRRDRENLFHPVNHALQSLIDDGTLDTILDRWL